MVKRRSEDAVIRTLLRTLDPNTYYVFGGRALSLYFKKIKSVDWDIAFNGRVYNKEYIMRLLKGAFGHKLKCEDLQMANISNGSFETVHSCMYNNINILDFKFVGDTSNATKIYGISYISCSDAIKNLNDVIKDQKDVINEFTKNITSMNAIAKNKIDKDIKDLEKWIQDASGDSERESYLRDLMKKRKSSYKRMVKADVISMLRTQVPQYKLALTVLKKNNDRLSITKKEENKKTYKNNKIICKIVKT
jgi:hypothetical protein